jgi:hypothetical protein
MLGGVELLAHFILFGLQTLQLVFRSLAIRFLDAVPVGLDAEDQFLGEPLESRDLSELRGTFGEAVQRQPGRNGNQGGKSQHKGKTDGQLASDLDVGEERKCAIVIHVCGCSKQVNKRGNSIAVELLLAAAAFRMEIAHVAVNDSILMSNSFSVFEQKPTQTVI